VFNCMQDMLVVRIEFIFIVEEAELCIVFLFGLHHYLHLNAVLGNEHCCTFYYCMHLLCMRLQHRAVIVSKYSKGNQLITIIYRTLSSTLCTYNSFVAFSRFTLFSQVFWMSPRKFLKTAGAVLQARCPSCCPTNSVKK